MSKKKKFFGLIIIIILILTIFSTALPILYSNDKAGKVNKEIENIHFDFLKDETKKYVLLFFGYAGCDNICPPALNEISQIYDKLDKEQFSFYFINLQPNISKDGVDPFAKAFNKDFKGIYLDNKKLIDITTKFQIKYSPINSIDIDHTGFLYLLEKSGNTIYKQKFIYTARPFDIEYISNDLNTINRINND
ncbi:SCO family protein [Halarcobacter sp.]|uniref:SCO family protein n=1 Tax=Halarcobacter sp. TaxID=2321133 RepID=UPI002AA6150E|nr:SCO family protein [Halarcobacter sp.]